MDWNWFLFSFKGRINRGKMWLSVLVILCWMIFLGMLAFAIGAIPRGGTFSFDLDDLFRVIDPATYRSLSWADLPVLLIKVTGTTLFLWVYFATSIKRLHDRDKSGWWMIPFFVGPGIFNQFADRLGNSYLLMATGLVAFVFLLWGFIEMFFLKGSRKTNRFGPNPLQPPDTRPRWDQQSEVELVPHKAGPPPDWRVKPGA
jgi:uncharacterized membrane protein YhaH (DUF805 family)